MLVFSFQPAGRDAQGPGSAPQAVTASSFGPGHRSPARRLARRERGHPEPVDFTLHTQGPPLRRPQAAQHMCPPTLPWRPGWAVYLSTGHFPTQEPGWVPGGGGQRLGLSIHSQVTCLDQTTDYPAIHGCSPTPGTTGSWGSSLHAALGREEPCGRGIPACSWGPTCRAPFQENLPDEGVTHASSALQNQGP